MCCGTTQNVQIEEDVFQYFFSFLLSFYVSFFLKYLKGSQTHFRGTLDFK